MAARVIEVDRSPVCIHFGRRLRHWRKTAGLTQAELGRRLMYDHSYISKVESGSRWPPQELAVRCDELLGAGQELVELWLLADSERRRAPAWPKPPPAALAGLATVLAGDVRSSSGSELVAEAIEQHRRHLMDWLATAPRPVLRRLIDLTAEP